MEDRMLALREKVTVADCTVEELREYCTLAFPPRPGMWLQEVDKFILPDSMQAYNWLRDWWRLDNPPKQYELNLLSMLWAIYVPENQAGPPVGVTLNDKVLQFYNRAKAYCDINGLDPSNAQEDPEVRRKRLNRERMAKTREARRVPDKSIADDTVRAQVRELEAQIEQVKQNAKEADEQHRQEVVRYQQLMIEAAETRKAVAQSYKDEVERLRSDIKQLTAKQ